MYEVSASFSGIEGNATTDALTEMDVHLYNPSPGAEEPCEIFPDIYFVGYVQTKGCDLVAYGDGTWYSPWYSDGLQTSLTGNSSWADGETSQLEGWADVTGFHTIALWSSTLYGGAYSYYGRQVDERDVPSGVHSNTCGVDAPTTVTGGAWNVGYVDFNTTFADGVGPTEAFVNAVRALGTWPCQVLVPQGMYLYYGGDSGTAALYYTEYLAWLVIDDTKVGSSKNGQSYWKYWP